MRRIAACQGPSRTATTATEAVRLADKGNFTGEPLACWACYRAPGALRLRCAVGAG